MVNDTYMNLPPPTIYFCQSKDEFRAYLSVHTHSFRNHIFENATMKHRGRFMYELDRWVFREESEAVKFMLQYGENIEKVAN